jgi:hypothetical protein
MNAIDFFVSKMVRNAAVLLWPGCKQTTDPADLPRMPGMQVISIDWQCVLDAQQKIRESCWRVLEDIWAWRDENVLGVLGLVCVTAFALLAFAPLFNNLR